MKKAVLITTSLDYGRELQLFDHTTPVSPPLGILSLGSFLATQGVPVELIDVKMDFGFGLTEEAEETIAQKVSQYLRAQADEIAWVGISQITNTPNGVALARAIRSWQPNLPIVFGGYFPTGSHAALLREYPFITAVVRGDGEMAALEISRCLSEGYSFLTERTPNLAWQDEAGLHTAPILAAPLDKLPVLDFRLLKNPTRYPHIDLATSRGCPYACNYCLESGMRRYANYSAAWVDEQLTSLEQAVPNRRISLLDPIFGVGKSRSREILQILEHHPFQYEIESRVDVLAVETIPELVRCGVEVIYLGVESGSPDTLVRMHKVPTRARAEEYLRKSMKILQACFSSGLTPAVGFMLGFPGDREQDYQATLAYAKEVKQLYERVSSEHGTRAGYVVYPAYTRIYSGSTLERDLKNDLQGAQISADPFIGSLSILRPSAETDADLTWSYISEIAKQDAWTDLATRRIQDYMLFPMRQFLDAHPEWNSADGICRLHGESLL